MNGIYWVLAAMAIIGFLPLVVYLYKRKLFMRILKTGLPARAVVYAITKNIRSSNHIVYYHFHTRDGRQYKGKLMIQPGVYRLHDPIDIFYLPFDPKRNTAKGAWGSPFMMVFVCS